MRNLFVSLVLLLLLVVPQFGDENFETGKITDKVICKADANQSYALYLPPNYSKEKKFPIIYVFDPGAQAKHAVELFQPAAETFGYIVVCSYNSRNGPTAPIVEAIKAIWADTLTRFSVDEKRIYASGFSGGARVASRFHLMIRNNCAGIIACGAGLSTGIKDLNLLKPLLWYGIVGVADFNYKEMQRLDKDFDGVELRHNVEILDMGHRWPPKDALTRAVAWMEMEAMKNKTRPQDTRLIGIYFNDALERAKKMESEGHVYLAVRELDTARQLLEGLTDTSLLKQRLKVLTEKGTYKIFLIAEAKREKLEVDIRRILYRVVMLDPPDGKLNLNKMITALELDELVKLAATKGDIFRSGLAKRSLYQLAVSASGRGGRFYRQKDWRRAAIYFEICARTGMLSPTSYYNLACVYSLDKKKKKSLKNLKRAIEKGFTNRAHIGNDKDLHYINKEKEFRELLKNL